MLLVLPQNARESQIISFSIEESPSLVTATCSFSVRDGTKFGEWNRVVCSSTSGIIPVIRLKLHRIASLPAEIPYELIQVSVSDESGDWSISSCSSLTSSNPSYIVSLVGQLSKTTDDRQVKAHRRSILSVQRAESSNNVSSPLLTIAATCVGSVVLVVAIVAMVANKNKSVNGGRSPTPPRIASVSPVASASNSPSSLSDVNVLTAGESGTPSSQYLAGGTTSSTLATSTSYSPTGMAGNGGGVISTSISPTVGRSMLSMSPSIVDTALHANATLSARTNVSSPGRAQSSLSPQISARSSKSNPSSSNASRVVGAGVVSAATNQASTQSNATGVPTKSTGIGAFFSKKKTERVAFLEPLISPKPRSWAPAVVANTSLTSLPNEPVPKAKPRFLVSAQASTKLPNARRPVRYQDFVPSTSFNKYGTYSRAHSKQALQHSRSSTADDDLDFLDAAFGNSSKSLKKASGLPAVTMIGGVDSVLGDEDGPGGLFLYDDDDWIADVVEPDYDDPIYKNDTNYTHIDVDSLMPVDDALIDASVDLIESHLSAITSPLSIPVADPTNDEPTEEVIKKKKKKKSGTSSKRSKQTSEAAEGSATAGAHSSSPSATVADISTSPTSPSPPIAASDLTLSSEKISHPESKAHSPRPSANPHRAPAPGTWRPSRNTPTIPLVSIASSRSAENISVSPNSSAPTSPVISEVKVRKIKDKSPREKEVLPDDAAPVVKKRTKKKRTEATPTADLSEPTTTEESTTEPSTPREKKDKKDKEKKKRKRREKEEETND